LSFILSSYIVETDLPLLPRLRREALLRPLRHGGEKRIDVDPFLSLRNHHTEDAIHIQAPHAPVKEDGTSYPSKVRCQNVFKESVEIYVSLTRATNAASLAKTCQERGGCKHVAGRNGSAVLRTVRPYWAGMSVLAQDPDAHDSQELRLSDIEPKYDHSSTQL
jgi:hypothetical protein